MNDPLLAPFALTWNPYSPAVPTEALLATPAIEHFLRRIEKTQLKEGGFALVTGDPGVGKSVVLRLLAERLERLPEVEVGALPARRGTSPTSTASSAISSASRSGRTTAGPAPRRGASAGSSTSRRRSCARCCSSTRRRR